MTSHIKNRRLLLVGLLALAAIATAIAMMIVGGEDDLDEVAPPEPAAALVELEAWPSADAQPVRISIDSERGPTWERGDETTVLTPASDELSFDSWTVETLDDRTRVVGKGTMGQAKASAAWSFVDGNPQAHLTLEINGIPSDRLASTLALTRPNIGDEAEDDARNHLVLWQPPAGLECHVGEENVGEGGDEGDENDQLTFDLRTQQIVNVQQTPAISQWRYSNGASAQLVPIFDLPADHSDPQIAQIAADDASAWLRRARTLIYGHSNTEDPRYGNGGLLGHGLGATIAVPPQWADHPGIRELADDLRGSRVELAPRGAAVGSSLQGTRFAIGASCRTLVELGDKAVPAAIVGTLAPEGGLSQMAEASELMTGAASLPAAVVPVEFDGQLTSLLIQGLNTRSLDQIVRERANYVFSTPFVATRNPLIGPFKDALIEPERDGQWTVAGEVSEALANLELWREATPLLVTSVGSAASYASASQKVLHWWTADGTLQVFNPGSKVIPGYTIVVAGSTAAQIDEAAISSRPILLDAERQATLLWWNLEPGVHSLQLSDEDDALSRPSPVDWHIVAP